MQFSRWSIFLPRAASSNIEQNTVYVRSRHTGNPQFFEQTRERLASILHDLGVLHLSGVPPDTNEAEPLELVLEAQHISLGYLHNRQFHKALAIGELCVQLVDKMALMGSREDNLLFWRILCRANLGDSLARFRKFEEAKGLLRQGLELAEEAAERAGARERVLVGACYGHLSRVHLELETDGIHESLKYTDLEIEDFETYIWELADGKADREVQAMVLASAYSNRGVCDVRMGRHERALEWFNKGYDCVEAHADLGSDKDQILTEIKEHIEHTKHLQI